MRHVPGFAPILDLHLAADGVLLEQSSWRGRHLATRRLPCAPAMPGSTPWQGALDALREAFTAAPAAAPALAAGARVRVLLSDALVHHCLIPRQARMVRGEEQAAYARHAFRAEYGNAVDQWQVALCTDARGTGFASLIDARLLAELHAVCRAARQKLVSVRPHFAATQAALAGKLRGASLWLVVLEGGRISAGLYAERTWLHLVSARASAAAGENGADFIARTLAAHSLGIAGAQATRVLHLAAAPEVLSRLRFGADWSVHLHADRFGLGAAV